MARVENPSLVGTHTGAYLSVGVRVGRFTPYVTWSDVTVNSERSDPGLDLAGGPQGSMPR